METWITADLHFCHHKIREFHPNRPGKDIDEMNSTIIENYRSVVNKRDNVWIIGDFSLSFDRETITKCFNALPGSKHLIRGNHDPNWLCKLPGWSSIKEMRIISVGPHKYFLCHYPMLTWDGAHRGVKQLHGHCHGLLDPAWSNPAQMDVGIDCHPEFRPFHIDEVNEQLEDYYPVDQHK